MTKQHSGLEFLTFWTVTFFSMVIIFKTVKFFVSKGKKIHTSHWRWHPFHTRTQKANQVDNKYVLAHVHSASRYPHWHQCCTPESGYQQKPPVDESYNERWINSTVPWGNRHSASPGIFSCRVEKIFFFQFPVLITCRICTGQFFKYPG